MWLQFSCGHKGRNTRENTLFVRQTCVRPTAVRRFVTVSLSLNKCAVYFLPCSFLPQFTFSLYISGTSTQNKYRPFWFRSLQLPLIALTSLIAALLKSQSGKTFGLMNLARLRWRAARPQIITLQNAPDNWIDKLNITNAEWGLGLHGFL